MFLAQLGGASFDLHVCTSKPHAYAGKIVEHFELMPHFGKVYGSELSGERSQKAELIAHILEEENLVAEETLMIGDRKHDLIGANANGVAGVGVLWGLRQQRGTGSGGAGSGCRKAAGDCAVSGCGHLGIVSLRRNGSVAHFHQKIPIWRIQAAFRLILTWGYVKHVPYRNPVVSENKM